MREFLVKRWFLIALVVVLAIGFTQASNLQFLANETVGKWVRRSIVASVLFMMAFPLTFTAFTTGLRRPGPAFLASAVNFGILPLFSWAVYFCLLPVLDHDLAIGLLVAAATPSTLASAAVWTRRAGGNDSVAIMVTIFTNLGCFLITPLWLLTMTGTQVESLELTAMIVKLLLLVVIPMTFAQLLRLQPTIGAWSAKNKQSLGVGAQTGVLAMILLGSVNAGLRIQGEAETSGASMVDFTIMIAAVLGIHIAMLWVGHVLARAFKMARQDRIAVGFSGSQKTLMVGLAIAIEDYGKSHPLAVLPMVTYHVGQLLVDTFVADRLRKAVKNEPD